VRSDEKKRISLCCSFRTSKTRRKFEFACFGESVVIARGFERIWLLMIKEGLICPVPRQPVHMALLMDKT